jgi:hypothetical protein
MDNRVKMNVDVFIENKYLCIRFDIISDHKKEISDILALSNLEQIATTYANARLVYGDVMEIQSTKSDIYSKRIIKNSLKISSKRLSINSLQGELKNKHFQIGRKMFNHNTIIYKLPTTPYALINWMIYLSIFLSQITPMKMTDHIQLGGHAPFEAVNNMNIEEMNRLFYSNNIKYTAVSTIMKIIVSFKDKTNNELAAYKDALIDFEKLCNYYLDNLASPVQKTLIQCIPDQTRFDLIYADSQGKALDTVLNPNTDSAKIEFLFMIELLCSKRKIDLILSCIGKTADDNNLYTTRYPELMLIYFGQFRLVEDKKIGIVDLENNPSYIDDYAEGKQNHDILVRELKHLAKCLEWEFDPDVDFHRDKKIVFSERFSSKLIESGLFINADFCRDLVNVYKLWTFLTKIKLENNNVFSKLSDDIFDSILTLASPRYQQFDHKIIYPAFFKAINLGKERGKQLHAEIADRKRQTCRN